MSDQDTPSSQVTPTVRRRLNIDLVSEEKEDRENVQDLLLNTERKLDELYKNEKTTMDKQLYSCDFLYAMRNVVKHHKKTPSPVDPNLLKQKGLFADETCISDQKLCMEFRWKIRSILNKITWKSYTQLSQEFLQLDVNQSPIYQEIAADLISEKASDEPMYSQLYAQLCYQLVNKDQHKATKFWSLLTSRASLVFTYRSLLDCRIKIVAAKLDSEIDQAKRANLAERLEFLKGKAKRHTHRSIKFFAQLYIMGFYTEHKMSEQLHQWCELFEKTSDEVYVEYGLELLEEVCAFYYSEQRVNERQRALKCPDHVGDFIAWISKDQCKNRMSTRMKFLIMNFEDFVRAGYVKRNQEPIMDEIEPFIKLARSALTANGSAFISYNQFLQIYRINNDEEFEEQALKAGYESGKHAILHHAAFFELRDDLIRRADMARVACFSRKYVNQKAKNPKLPNRQFNQNYKFANINGVPPSNTTRPWNNLKVRNNGHEVEEPCYDGQIPSAQGSKLNVRNYEHEKDAYYDQYYSNVRDPNYNYEFSVTDYGYEKDSYYDKYYSKTHNQHYKSNSKNYADNTYDGQQNCGDYAETEYYDAPTSKNNYEYYDNHTTNSNCKKEDKPYYEHDDRQPDSNSTSNIRNNKPYRDENLNSTFYEHDNRVPSQKPNPANKSLTTHPEDPFTLINSELSASAKNSATPKSPFSAHNTGKFDSRTVDEVVEQIGKNLLPFIQDIYNQGMATPLRHDSLSTILQRYKMNANFSLQNLKCFLAHFFADCFQVKEDNENAFSVKSNSKEQIQKLKIPSFVPQVKEQQIRVGERYSCQILGADQDVNNLLIYLSPYLWKDAYAELVAELSRYASMISFLEPLDFIFKSDRLLYFDDETRKFYRCIALSAPSQEEVEIFTPDEFQKCKVNIKNLYRMPNRFYKYQDMVFTLKISGAADQIPPLIKHLRQCALREHTIEISASEFEGIWDGAAIYTGQFHKIT